MTDAARPGPTIVELLDVEAAAAALCCRFGEPMAEAYRLSVLHDFLASSRTLARTLDSFTALAAEHYRGIHCTADMRGDAQRLARALESWSQSVFVAGSAYREWTTDGAIAGLSAEPVDPETLASSFATDMHDHAAPSAPPV
jgi:hypothetical protein